MHPLSPFMTSNIHFCLFFAIPFEHFFFAAYLSNSVVYVYTTQKLGLQRSLIDFLYGHVHVHH